MILTTIESCTRRLRRTALLVGALRVFASTLRSLNEAHKAGVLFTGCFLLTALFLLAFDCIATITGSLHEAVAALESLTSSFCFATLRVCA